MFLAISLQWLLVQTAACTERSPFTDGGAVIDVAPDIVVSRAGSPCGLNENGEPSGSCSAGQFCLGPGDGFPNGYCAPDCRQARCAEGSECFAVDGTRRYCVRVCVTDADCRIDEGYACRLPFPGARPACVPDNEPLGRRDHVRACYATDSDAGPGPYLAPLPSITFVSSAVSVSRTRIDTRAEAEASVAVEPVPQGNGIVGFMGLDSTYNWRGGITRVPGGAGAISSIQFRDRDFPDTLQPSVAFDRSGRLHLMFLGSNLDRPGNPVRHATSDDGGQSFADARSVFPLTDCNNGCTVPVMAVGPDTDGAADRVYAATIASHSDGSASVLFSRALATATAFDPSIEVAAQETTTDAQRIASVVALSAGPRNGDVYAAWIATSRRNASSGLGDRANRVRLRISHDAGQSFGPLLEVTRSGDAPIAQTPWVGAGGGAVHVVYVTGGLSGVWDVILATSTDGGASWSHRIVNDDPDRCATHAFAGMAIDPVSGDAHVIWLDNRYGNGIVAYAHCAASAVERCDRNELVSGEPFVFTTSLDPTRWHGTRSALALGRDGTLWAAWSDTRTGGPGIYLARGRR